MTCVTKIDRRAQKVLSRSVLICAIVAVCLGVALIALWGVLYLLRGEAGYDLLVISFAPVIFAVVLFVLYARQLKQANGDENFNVYDFGEVAFTVKGTRRGSFAGSFDVGYADVKSVKARSGFLVLYVKKLGAFVVDREQLGDFENTLKQNIAACRR